MPHDFFFSLFKASRHAVKVILVLVPMIPRSMIRGSDHEEPQALFFLHGCGRHIKEFGTEWQIPRIFLSGELNRRC